ncbi:MgtC/SapB family protein [Halomonas cupida]|uniref:MgtC/SapB family protein n=1 Tax=Halomonas cupida TaxID=44933 RepID=UPI003A8D34A4
MKTTSYASPGFKFDHHGHEDCIDLPSKTATSIFYQKVAFFFSIKQQQQCILQDERQPSTRRNNRNEPMEPVVDAITSELSDFTDLSEFIVAMIRLLFAALLGGLLGLEREQRGKPAGVRTHMLVCMGAALFIFIPQQAGISDVEMSRVIQGVIAGIGFLCAGTIITGKDDQGASGLTTAAGVWFTAAIGVAVGLGREQTAVICTALAWIVLYVVPFFTRSIHNKPP